ncbi:MAG: response regulator [Cyanobacteria bacterium P01_F01_bin.53]
MVQAPVRPYLLIVEDSDEDFESLQRILAKTCHVDAPIVRCYDGDDAIDFLHRTGTYASQPIKTLPSLILLDLNLPGTDGREVLTHIKQDKHLKILPVVILTTSSNPSDIDTCYRYGANSYLLKHMDLALLKESIHLLMDYWLKAAVLPDTSIG